MSYSHQTFNYARNYLLNAGKKAKIEKVQLCGAPTLRSRLLPSPPKDSYNEVYPGIFIGDKQWVESKATMKTLGVTHIVNCAQGTGINQINTDSAYYKEVGIGFHGIKANDISSYDITPQFSAAAEFIDQALAAKGKIFVHCIMGISRSATIVLAFLMLKRDLTLLEAVKTVKQHRNVFPNEGFLRQLCILDNTLSEAKAAGKNIRLHSKIFPNDDFLS